MYHFATPIKDSTIYEYNTDKNVGSDEILELDRVNGDESRIVCMFDVDQLINKIDGLSGINYSCSVQFTTTEVSSLPIEYDIAIAALSKPFKRGTGRKFQTGISPDGVTWNETGTGIDWNTPGGDFFSAIESVDSYRFQRSDIDIEINDIFDDWVAGLNNNGLLLRLVPKYPNNAENVVLKYFGEQTHTIYQPRMVLKFDDSDVDTENAVALSLNDQPVSRFRELKNEHYHANKLYRFHVIVEPRFQKQPFVEEATDKTSRYLADGSVKYQIKDQVTGKTIIPFSDASTCSFNAQDGYYFDVDFTGWMPNRYYTIHLEYTHDIWGNSYDLTPTTNTFKLER